jgi:tRNA A-37 threonylcarbamoyl transferase component Bud32
MDYLAFGNSLISAHPNARTLCGDFEGRKLWIKQTVPPKARIWHKIQRLVASLTGMPILRATVITDGSHTHLEQEAERLCDFKIQGFDVPEVLAVYKEMMVMTDAGPQLRTLIDQTPETDKRLELLKQAATTLAKLHKKALAHGRPYLRDMTYNNGQVAFLDLEEDPTKVMSMSEAQARDVWIFLGSCSRYARLPGQKKKYDTALLENLFEVYSAHADPDIIKDLKKLVNFLMPLLKVIEKPYMWDRVGTDARQAGIATRALYNCLAKNGTI